MGGGCPPGKLFFLGGGKCPNLGVVNVRILGVVNVLLANDSQSKILDPTESMVEIRFFFCKLQMLLMSGYFCKLLFWNHLPVRSLETVPDI